MSKQTDWHKDPLTPETVIGPNFKTTQNVRRFFRQQTNSKITLDRPFREWLQVSAGKTLADAVAEYKRRGKQL